MNFREMSDPIHSGIRQTGLPAGLAVLAALALPALADPMAEQRKFADKFFGEYCVQCHGEKKQKGDVALHDLSFDLSGDDTLELWEDIAYVLEGGDMPPDDEKQPTDGERTAMAELISAGLRAHLEQADTAPTPGIETRRLTNFEYENTIRDLVGFDIALMDNLPEDPSKPYAFNNTTTFMRIGPEQLDRYLESARKVMASAIVDPGPRPETITARQEWEARTTERGLGRDEIGVYGNNRGTPHWGFTLKQFPKTGEFRVRVQASAILLGGATEVPLRLVMGQGLNVNSSTLEVAPIGTVTLKNSPDDPQVYEMTGRIENFPIEIETVHKGRTKPASYTITPQNLYDDGTLNDGNGFYKPRNITLPRIVINWIDFEWPITEEWPPAHHTAILFDSPLREKDENAYVREVLEKFMSRAYRRPATEDEVNRFVTIHKMIRPDFDTLEEAMRETLAMVLITPQFLYHTVADGGPTTPQFELASRLSYFLWGSMPDDTLLELAKSGKLGDEKVIEAQVERMLADERSADFVRNFTVQWLSIEKMKTVPINRDLFPRFLYYVPVGERAGTEEPYRPTIRDHMIDESVGFVGELIRRNAGVEKIVDSDFAYLNQPLAAHYGVEGVQGHELRPVSITDEHHLGGLLTHGSVLIGNGTGTAPHPIYRAVWLREAILGEEVAPPPAEVPALTDTAGESAEKALTIKDLLAKHRQEESCNDCHARLDPWGIPFEQYNAVGRYQPVVPKEGVRVSPFNPQTHADLDGYKEYLNGICTEPIEAIAKVPNGPEVGNMEELKDFLLEERKDDIAENVLRRLLGYGLGREITARDRLIVDQLMEESAKTDYALRDMIVSICKSGVFRNTLNKPQASQ